MSYTIEYDRQFIKSKHGIIPCSLRGSNNCYDAYRKRRSRNWAVFMNLLGVSEREMLDAVQDSFGGYQQHWMKNGKWIDDEGLKRWIRFGCANAAPIEDIIAANRKKSVTCFLSVWRRVNGDLDNTHALREDISTTEELDCWVDSVKAFLAANEDVDGYPIIEFNYGAPITHPKKKKKAPTEQVLLKHSTYGYLESIVSSPRGGCECRYTSKPSGAQEFSAETAEVLIHLHQLTKVKMVSAKIKKMYAPSVIRFSNGSFLYKKTAAKLYSTTNIQCARVYANRTAAEHAMLNPTLQAFCRKKGMTTAVIPFPTE